MVVVDAARAAVQQDWPDALHEVWVIAQGCAPEVLSELRTLPVRILELPAEGSTKARALNTCLSHLGAHVDVVVVLDADNVPMRDFLVAIAERMSLGAVAVQGYRLEKNSDTTPARLEALMERANHVVYRAARARVGLSASLAGSAMAFRREVLEDALGRVDAVGGFDKALEMELIARGVVIDWAPAAVVLDEKVDDFGGFTRQKRRWVASSFQFAAVYGTTAVRAAIRHRSLDAIDKWLQWVALPRSVHLAVLLVATPAALMLLPPALSLSWLTLLVVMAVAMLATVAHASTVRDAAWAATRWPLVSAAMASAILQSRGANRVFLHTVHRHRADSEAA
jgi:cellulose synthase/poly-beta-1,6-N-acetylglucosamine synthase-like glycosyltransferase